MIYLDNSATTKPWPEAMETFIKASGDYFGNPSSMHQLGRDAGSLLSKARDSAASMLGVEAEEIIFTSGGSESNALAVQGTMKALASRGKHAVTTVMEHPSVLKQFQDQEKQGAEVTYLQPGSDGRVTASQVIQALRKDTVLVSIIRVQNEMGTVQPIEEIGRELAAFPKIYFHTDDVQGAGKLPIDLSYVDLYSLSSHKFHGVRGAGILVKKKGKNPAPLIMGGAQENGMRAGTENVPAIAAMVKALRLSREAYKASSGKLRKLHRKMTDHYQEMTGVEMNTPASGSVPYILNISVKHSKPEAIVEELSGLGIYISSKSACSSKEKNTNSVLGACGFTKERAETALRISLSTETTEQDIDKLLRACSSIFPAVQLVVGGK